MKETIRIESVSQVHQFMNAEKPKHPLVTVVRYGNQDHNILEGYRFILDLYQVTLKVNLAGSFKYGRNQYDFEEGTLIFSKPGQVLEFNNIKEVPGDYEGWMLIFHPDLIRKSELGKEIDNYSFFSYDANEALHVSDEEKKSLHEIVNKIEKEYSQPIDRHSQNLIVSNIKILLDYCTRYFDRQFYTRTNQNKDVVSEFEQLLKAYYHSEKPVELGVPSVAYCGKELGMSPYYLSDLLKKETGRNAKEHIHFFIIEKAKTDLLGSTDPVSQIAYDLGFDYPQHFARLFKHKTGLNPTEYRNVN